MRMALADLRDSWSAWVAVSLTFVVASGAVGLSALLFHSARASEGLEQDYRLSLIVIGALNVAICSIVALAVISTSTGLVIGSRRGAMARLLLAGAAPGQVIRMLLLQLGIVTLACSIVGNVAAALVLPPVLKVLAEDRGYAPPEAMVSLPVLLASSLYCAAVAMVGGLRQAHRATAIPPVEALRSSMGATPLPTRRWVLVLQWLGFTICVGAIVASVVAVRVGAEDLGKDAFQTVMQTAALSLPLFGLALSLVAASVVAPLSRLWTRLVPLPGATWHLARHTVVARADRLVKSVVPVMFAVGLLFGMMTLGSSVTATLRANGAGFELEGASITALLSFMGLPIAIAFAGSVGNLVMMTRQRDAELALNGVIGATPRQQVLLPALEATIVTGTAAVLGLIMAGVSTGVLAYGMRYVLPTSEISMPFETLLWILLASWLITLLATVLPSLPSLRQPAPRVVARLVAT